MMPENRKVATVNDIGEMMMRLAKAGFGDYKVDCNAEYWLAMKGDEPEMHHDKKFISLGGYDG